MEAALAIHAKQDGSVHILAKRGVNGVLLASILPLLVQMTITYVKYAMQGHMHQAKALQHAQNVTLVGTHRALAVLCVRFVMQARILPPLAVRCVWTVQAMHVMQVSTCSTAAAPIQANALAKYALRARITLDRLGV